MHKTSCREWRTTCLLFPARSREDLRQVGGKIYTSNAKMIGMVSKEDVMKALKECYDPEIGISVVDLGLIYDVKVDKDKVHIKMTLTTPGCPMFSYLTQDVQNKVKKIKGVKDVKVELVWDPPWNPDRMSKGVRKKLGL
jgi:metal-sulfur cluster biosynthetic enzyme